MKKKFGSALSWRPALALPLVLVLPLASLLGGCEESDPQATPDANVADAAPVPDTSSLDAGECVSTVPPIDESACVAEANDYVGPATEDGWPVCISDQDLNVYARFDANVGSIARVAQLEMIAPLLWDNPQTPTTQDFTDARLIYLTAEGLESRLVRREDEHYAPVLNDLSVVVACGDLTPVEQQANADRCVGPARIVPVVNDAFTAGIAGEGDARVHAARIEAALLWFLYVSVHKEAITCTAKQKDCDSAYAYYTGGASRTDAPLGFSRYVRGESTKTHDRVWDGILAVRCWRDLDNPAGTAVDLALRDRAVAQLDRAALRGVAVIVRARALTLLAACDDPVAQARAWAFVRVLAPVLDREATLRDATNAALLRTEVAKTDPAAVDVPALVAALDAVFPCP